MNKSFITNAMALAIACLGYFQHNNLLFIMGIFALSGALTNWLAIHMLFEKIPGLYGSGVIPTHFEEFKTGIRKLIMEQFFSDDNIDQFLSQNQQTGPHSKIAGVIDKVDLSPAFDSLIKTIMGSSFGGMLAMVGGEEALIPLKEPFIDNMRQSIIEIADSDEFSRLLIDEIEASDSMSGLKDNIQDIIDKRLDELTPQVVKTIIQDMIRKHLGWLVVWGGLFGGLIGLASAWFELI